MRIEEINISGFGIFNQAKVKNLDPCLNIMLGENESGKSTCLEFLRTVLFGNIVGEGARKAIKYPIPPGSEPGGSILFKTTNNQIFKQSWQPGPGLGKQGLWLLGNHSNNELEARDINEFSRLTGYITRQLYSAVYGFSLDQLQELNSLEKDARVADILYGAGFGLGAVSLPQVLRNLQEKYKESLFKSSGKKQPINQIMARLKALREEMKEYAKAMPKYNEIEQELANLNEKLGKNQCELAQLRVLQICLQDLAELQLNLPRLQQMHLRMDDLAPQTLWSNEQVAVLENYIFTDIRALDLQTNKLQNELNNIALEQARLAQALGSGAQYASILENKAAIKSLLEQKAHYMALQQEYTSINDSLSKLYSSSHFLFCFGQAFKGLPPEEQQLSLGVYLQKAQAAKDELGQIYAQWQFLNNTHQLEGEDDVKIYGKSGELDQPDRPNQPDSLNQPARPNQPGEPLQQIPVSQTQTPQPLNTNMQESFNREKTAKMGKFLGLDYRVIIGLELAVAGALFIWLYKSPQVSPLWMALELGVLFLIIVGIGFKFYKKNRAHGLEQLAEQKILEQRQSFKEGRQILLGKAGQVVTELLPLLGLGANGNQAVLLSSDIAAILNHYPEKYGNQMQDTLDAWQQAHAMLIRLQQIEDQLLPLDEQVQRLFQQLTPTNAAREPGANLQGENMPQANPGKTFLPIISDLENRLNQAQEAQLEQSNIAGKLASFSQQQLDKQAELGKLRAELEAIYAQAKVRSLDELEVMYKLWIEKTELIKSMGKLDNELLAGAREIFNKLSGRAANNGLGRALGNTSPNLSGNDFGLPLNNDHSIKNLLNNILFGALAGPAPAQLEKGVQKEDDLFTLMQVISPETLLLQIESVVQRIQALEVLVKEAIKEQGALQQQASDLMGEDRLTALGFEESALQEELNTLSRKWSVAALAEHFVLQAKTAFEQEHQTAVMSGASKYFKQITNGAYQGLDPSASIGSFAVLTQQGESRTPEQLSRGTREQLYLALRLALIEERTVDTSVQANGQAEEGINNGNYAKKTFLSEPLPLIMDDVLVNFDPERVKRSIKSILTLASRHQIFYFTCQPHMLPLLREQAEKCDCSYKCFNLAGGQISPA